MQLKFLPGHVLELAVRVSIHAPDSPSTRLKGRLEETRRALLAGDDAWSPRFTRLEPAAERRTWEKTLGELSSVSHEALLDDPETLPRFFSDTSLGVAWKEGESRSELTLTPYPPAGATAQERAAVGKALGTWSEAIAGYLERAHALYAYLEHHPERASACLGLVFKEDLDEKRIAALPAATADEEQLAEALRDAMKEAAAILVVGENESSSLDEMSHREYDPFPARLSIKVPGPILELEGFTGAAVGDGPQATLRVRGLGFWDALASLRGRWLAPNPLLLHIAHQRAAGDVPLDLEAVVATPRRSETAKAGDIRLAIEERLRPEPIYRVVWSTEGLPAEPDAALRSAWSDPE